MNSLHSGTEKKFSQIRAIIFTDFCENFTFFEKIKKLDAVYDLIYQQNEKQNHLAMLIEIRDQQRVFKMISNSSHTQNF